VSDQRWIFLVAAFLSAAAIWLLLPRSTARGRSAGAVLGAMALGMFAAMMPRLSGWVAQGTFWVLAAVTVVAAAAAVTLPSPVYCAIWFGMALLGTAGLFLFQGAQFLAVATVVVYAGAILVTFLFILMLAQPSGRARYDRVSFEGMLSGISGALLVSVLSMTATSVLASPAAGAAPRVTAESRQQGVLAEAHVQQIGHALFGRYLVAVEVAGTLLLAALVGAAVIVGKARGPLAGPGGPSASPDSARRGGGPHG